MKVVLLAAICVFPSFGQSEKERALGQALAAEIERGQIVVRDAEIVGYVERLAQKLSSQCFGNTTVDARVIVSSEPNGSALPGGILFVNTGLIREAESEAELAGVLGHLMARVMPGPPPEAKEINGATLPVIFVGGRSGYAYRPTVHAPVAFAAAQRAAVSAADTRAVECISAAGYDPEGFIASLKKTEEAKGPQKFSTHPAPSERIENVQARIDRIASKPQYLLNTGALNELRRRVERIYPAPRVNDPAPPSLRRAALPQR